ncbi:MAG: UvrB/UvrC motif-containing protein [Desulfitobacterium sp.]
MLCQHCQQREANVQITKIENGEMVKLFICDQCAKNAPEVSFVFNPGIIPDFLQSLFSVTTNSKALQEEACPQCGRRLSEITQAGKLGCSGCYDKFQAELEPILRKIHGGGYHVGKIPARKGASLREKMEVKKLKEKLQQLIRNEEFEAAATVRDQIRKLEQKLGE